MARQPRKFEYNRFLHVFNKFNPELSLGDRHLNGIRKIIRKSKEKFNVDIVNYAIINNHFHLEVYFKEENGVSVSKYMQWLGTVIAMYVNKVLGRRGRVFIDRFKSKILETMVQIRNVFDYILYNITKHRGTDPSSWPYSGYHYYKFNMYDPIITDIFDF